MVNLFPKRNFMNFLLEYSQKVALSIKLWGKTEGLNNIGN